MWYSEAAHKDINAEDRSLIVAFANLLSKFGYEDTPESILVTLRQDGSRVNLDSLLEYYEDIVVDESVLDSSEWPQSSDSIVVFRRLDEERAGVTDHYCVMADHRARSIIDSLDGKIKPAGLYGTPVVWTAYRQDETYIEELEAQAMENSVQDPNKWYVVRQPGENIHHIGTRIGIPGQELIEHNDLGDQEYLEGGTELHLPISKTQDEEEEVIQYEVLETPLNMHVSSEEGITKFSFGNVQQWGDIKPTGPRYAHKVNLKILAIAHVLIPEDGKRAAFYLDSLSLGNFPLTGRIQYTTGFNHSHLAEGDAPLEQEEKRSVEQKKKKVAKKVKEVQDVVLDKNSWKATQQRLNEQRAPVMHIAKQDIMVHDIDNRRPSKMLYQHEGALIYSTFEKADDDGNVVVYGRPMSSVENGNWFGIPMHLLYNEDELLSTPTVGERMVLDEAGFVGQLSLIERYWVKPLSQIIARFPFLREFFDEQNKKNKE